jgi:hypothetical protein
LALAPFKLGAASVSTNTFPLFINILLSQHQPFFYGQPVLYIRMYHYFPKKIIAEITSDRETGLFLSNVQIGLRAFQAFNSSFINK